VVVYIEEAHANDVWPLGKHVDLPTHKTFADRVAASKILINKYGCRIPVMYDGMDNKFDSIFAVWPERYYLVSNDKMQYIWYPTTEFGFNRLHMLTILNRVYDAPTVDLEEEPAKEYLFSYEMSSFRN